MKHSCIIINEKFLTDGTPPVSSLNPAFVCWQAVAHGLKTSLGGSPSRDQSGVISAPVSFDVHLASDTEMREAFHQANQSGNSQVHPYPIQALTGNYEAYATELAATSPHDIRYLALAIREANGEMHTWMNQAYCSDALVPLVKDASLLGWASGFDYPDDSFGYEVADKDCIKHSYLTRIGHLFRKEKGNKFDRLTTEGPATISNFYAVKEGDQPSMVCVYSDETALKGLKIHQMSSARMHDDLIEFRKATDARFTQQ